MGVVGGGANSRRPILGGQSGGQEWAIRSHGGGRKHEHARASVARVGPLVAEVAVAEVEDFCTTKCVSARVRSGGTCRQPRLLVARAVHRGRGRPLPAWRRSACERRSSGSRRGTSPSGCSPAKQERLPRSCVPPLLQHAIIALAWKADVGRTRSICSLLVCAAHSGQFFAILWECQLCASLEEGGSGAGLVGPQFFGSALKAWPESHPQGWEWDEHRCRVCRRVVGWPHRARPSSVREASQEFALLREDPRSTKASPPGVARLSSAPRGSAKPLREALAKLRKAWLGSAALYKAPLGTAIFCEVSQCSARLLRYGHRLIRRSRMTSIGAGPAGLGLAGSRTCLTPSREGVPEAPNIYHLWL